MGTMRNLIRIARGSIRLSALLLLVTLLAWTSLTQVSACTRTGVQCPTAPTQSVVDALKCCGKTIGYTQRAVRPGDKGFVQCQCAEKQAAQHQTELAQGPGHFELLCARPYSIDLPVLTPKRAKIDEPVGQTPPVNPSPPVPPPSLL